MEFSADGKMLATAGGNRWIKFWRFPNLTQLKRVYEYERGIWSMTFSPDGEHFLMGGNREALVWSMTRHADEPLAILKHNGRVFNVAYQPGMQTFFTGDEEQTARFWSAKDFTPLSPPLKQQVIHSAYFRKQNLLFTVGTDPVGRSWEVPFGRFRATPIRHDDKIKHMASSSQLPFLITGSHDKTARIWQILRGNAV